MRDKKGVCTKKKKESKKVFEKRKHFQHVKMDVVIQYQFV